MMSPETQSPHEPTGASERRMPPIAMAPEAGRIESHAERAEARRLQEIARNIGLSRSIEDRREFILTSREDDAGRTRLLSGGVAVTRMTVGDPGCNETDCIVLADPSDESNSVTSFVKRAVGERAMRYDSQSDKVLVARREFDSVGNLVTRWEIDRQASRDSGVIESLRSRETDMRRTREEIAAAYGIDPDKLPLDQTEYGARNIDVGHSVKAEVAVSVIDDAVGFGCIARTATRSTERSLGSAQEGLDGYPPSIQVYKEVLRQGPEHPAFRSLMRLACMDYLVKSTDRSPNNTFYCEEAQEFRGIDNGYAMGYSRKGPDGRIVSADPLVSVPMEMMEGNEGWTLDDDARASLDKMLRDVADYGRYSSGQMSAEEAAALEPEVRAGVMSDMLRDTFRMLYERLDDNGEVTPETSAIANQEAIAFLGRAKHLVDHGRPPKLSDKEFQRTGFGIMARLP